jgi:SAM-dependent methyltransferase
MESVNCVVCGAEAGKAIHGVRDRLLGHPASSYRVVRCRRCGLVYLNPRPHPDRKESFYGDGYDFDVDKEPTDLSLYQPVIDYLDSNQTQGRLLDIGTGNSLFLPVMRDRGWEVFGTELNRRLVEKFQTEHGIGLHYGDLASAGFPEGSFDAVTMFGVIEHVSDPVALLRRIAALLKDDGVICLWSFNRSIEARLLGRYWPGFDPPRHNYSFTRKGLTELLGNAGFRVSSVVFPRTFMTANALHRAVLGASSRVTGRPTSGGSARHLPMPLRIASYPFSWLLSRSGCSSSLYMFAVRGEPVEKRAHGS